MNWRQSCRRSAPRFREAIPLPLTSTGACAPAPPPPTNRHHVRTVGAWLLLAVPSFVTCLFRMNLRSLGARGLAPPAAGHRRTPAGACSEDAVRHRIERDLHDGVQQRLICIGLDLAATEAALPPEEHAVRRRLADTARDLTGVMDCLREITHGLHPRILFDHGLEAALASLARRCPIPVELTVDAGRRLPASIEATIYYLVAEAMTNTLKHAHATGLRVGVHTDEEFVRVAVHDDGVGGADPAGRSGLTGLSDRVGALAGRLFVESNVGDGTSLLAEIPLPRGECVSYGAGHLTER